MNQQNQPTKDSNVETTSPELSQQSASRRKFLVRASVASLPVVASMQSGSAWGCIKLNCIPGEASLSNSASKVQSVASRTQGYIVPKWSTIAEIKDILVTDFDGYLQSTFSCSLYSKKSNSYLIAKTRSPLSTWKGKVLNVTCYYKSNNTYYTYTDTKLEPASYNDVLIDSTTNMGQFFPDMGTITVANALNSSNDFIKYVTAAFIGAVWESHPEYTKRFTTKCYPEASEIIRSYNLVKDRVVDGVRVGLLDMGRLFKLYTKTV
jgi:hypothetical protein